MVDAHVHLQDARLAGRLREVGVEAAAAGIRTVCCCATSPADWQATARIAAEQLPFEVIPAFGVHPWYASDLPSGWQERLETLLASHPSAALGEVGLDGIRNEPSFEIQETVFVEQLRMASRLSRPIVLHGAKAWDRLILRLRPFASSLPSFMAHAFNGSFEQMELVVALGGYVSVAGTLCNPHASRIRAVAARIPADRLLVETDSPDLFPERSQGVGTTAPPPLNTPANLPWVLDELAKLRGCSRDDLVELTTRNACRCLCARPPVALQ